MLQVVEKLRLLPWTTMSDEMLLDSIESIKEDYLSQVERLNLTEGIDSPWYGTTGEICFYDDDDTKWIKVRKNQ